MSAIQTVFYMIAASSFITGLAVNGIYRRLRKRGRIAVPMIDPVTNTWDFSWEKPTGIFLKLKDGGREGASPWSGGKIYSHRRNGRPLQIVDLHAMLPVTLDAQSSAMQYPNGEYLEKIEHGSDVRNFNEKEKGTNMNLLIVLMFIAVMCVVGMLAWALPKIAVAAASHGGH